MQNFKNKKAGILMFPGTNCDRDLKMVLEQYGFSVEFLWHRESFNVEHDVYFVPGGFSYGDYLRSGALAARSLSLQSLTQAIQKGILTVGICNGFQILTEARLLPGALIKNASLKHICKWVSLRPSETHKKSYPQNYSLPVSHSEGNYLADDDTLKELQDNNQILFRYIDDINGSTDRIAGISDKSGKLIGLMPHPERATHISCDSPQSNVKPGLQFFDSIFEKI